MRYLNILWFLISIATAQESILREVYDTKTDTHVEVTALFTQPSRGGYLPVRVKIANNLDAGRSIQLRFESSMRYDRKLQTNSSYELSAPAGKTISEDLMVPLVSDPHSYGDQPSVNVHLTGSLGTASGTVRTTTASGSPAVLMSESLFTPNASLLDAASVKSGSSRSAYGNHAFAGKFDPKQLPSSWLAFSGYDSVVLSDDDWSSVPAGSRNAILSWVCLGGQLIIYTQSNTGIASLGLPESPSMGSISIESMKSANLIDPAALIKTTESDHPNRPRSAAIQTDFSSSWPLQNLFGVKAFNYGIFIFVLIVFGILVGPVNLFLLAKSGQRHRLFITTPIISLAASLILIALIIFQDGFGGHGLRRVLMEVRPDAGLNAAFLHQEQISRTGILTGSRFSVDPACLFLPVPIATSRWARYTNRYGTAGTFNLQPRNGKLEASGDWWQSRSEHGHILTAVLPTRGRIERTEKEHELVSTFSFPIEILYYLDESNQWHRAENIQTGRSFTLTPVDATMAQPAIATEANAFSKRNQEILNRASRRKGHFIAVSGAANGIDTLPGIRWQETRTVITGPVVGK